MGSSSSKTRYEQLPPEELSEFRKLVINPEECSIPKIQEKRQPTDKHMIYVCGIVAFVLMIFISYTLYHRDSRRYTNGYDMCGNICGVKNEFVEGIDCSGKDMREFKYLQYDYNALRDLSMTLDVKPSSVIFAKRQCAEECNPKVYNIENNRCIPITIIISLDDSDNGKQYNDMIWAVGDTFLITLIGIGLCLFMLLLLRYITAIVIWFIVVVCYLLLIILTLFLWFVEGEFDAYRIVLTTVFTVTSVLVTILLIAVFKRIPLVIRILKEAMRVIWAIPLIIFVPLLTFLAIYITFLVYVFVTLNLLLCGVFTPAGGDIYYYDLTNTMTFTVIFNTIFTAWIVKFMLGCQTMVVSGTIATWYFSRDKSFMGSPIKNSFKNLIKFHLGSVFLGSLIMTAVSIFKSLVRSMLHTKTTKLLVSCCLNLMERLLIFITKNAYIMIAMHGEDFFRSGKRAVKLIHLNLKDVIALNSIGGFVLFMAKMFIVLLTMLLSCFIHDASFGLDIFIAIFVGSILAHSIFQVVETAIDTIFMCYCEDCFINDGVDRPYYMSAKLMQFFHDSRTVLAPNQLT